MADFYAQGNVTVQLCSKPDLEGCEFLGSVNVAGPTVKWNTADLPPAIGDDNLRSMLVVCGRPTTVIAYEHCNFRGRLARFQCDAGSQLEVPHLGPLAGKVSALVFTDGQSQAPTHIPIDLATDADADSVPDAVALLHSGISAAIAGTPLPGGGAVHRSLQQRRRSRALQRSEPHRDSPPSTLGVECGPTLTLSTGRFVAIR